jgi:hypothetical protein
MPTWTRTQGSSGTTTASNKVLGSIPAGSTLLRVHAGVRFSLRVPALADPNLIMPWGVGCGIYTTLESGGTVIYPISDNEDQDPPEQRWLWLERISVVPQPFPTTGLNAYWMWSGVPAANPIDIKAQVKASAALNLNLSWEPTAAAPAVVSVTQIVYWASFLYGA